MLVMLGTRLAPFLMLGGVVCSVYIALSLFSFSPGDSTALQTGVQVSNAGGPLGAWQSDKLLQVLGYGAWSVLPLGGLLAMKLAGRELRDPHRLVGWVAVLWVALCLMALIWPYQDGMAYAAGGLMGETSVAALRGVVGPAGAWLIVLGLTVAVLPIVTNIQLVAAADRGLAGLEQLGPRVRGVGEGVIGQASALLSASTAVALSVGERLRRPALPDYHEDDEYDYDEEEYEEADEPDSLPPSTASAPSPSDLPTQRPSGFFDEPSVLFRPDPTPPPADRTHIGLRELVEVEWETTSSARSARASVPPARTPPPAPSFEPAPPALLDEDDAFDDEDDSEDFEEEDEVSSAAGVAAAAALPDGAAPPVGGRRRKVRGGPRLEVNGEGLISGGDSDDGLAVIDANPYANFQLPNLGMLDSHELDVVELDEAELQEKATALEQKLADFGVKGEVVAIRPGPVITTFEYLPAPGIKLSKISGLADDIAMALKALQIRIIAPIPGKGVVGVEIPNKKRQMIWLKDLLGSDAFRQNRAALPMVMGKTVEGRPRITDLAKMPHLLVGGTTGSGKSVGINAMIMSLLYTRTPEELRFIMIDPKMLEFEMYHDIPHLLHPVVTDPKIASAALKWACTEMDERYRLLARWQTRNIESFNRKVEKEREEWTPARARRYYGDQMLDGEVPPPPRRMPYIVVVIDELADLMMVAAKDVEESIIRLAQKARAAGIHLIVATQRPSVNVITGLIKANMPSRVAFQIRTKVDSRTILDQNGAENLLGKGDMLFLPPGVSAIERCHGPFVSDEEVQVVTDFLRDQGAPIYEAEIHDPGEGGDAKVEDEEYDDLYDLAVAYVCREGKASTSMVQREFKIGYNRAARMIEVMEREGIVGPADGARPRDVLVDAH